MKVSVKYRIFILVLLEVLLSYAVYVSIKNDFDTVLIFIILALGYLISSIVEIRKQLNEEQNK